MTEMYMLQQLNRHVFEGGMTEFLHALRAGKTFCIAQSESSKMNSLVNLSVLKTERKQNPLDSTKGIG